MSVLPAAPAATPDVREDPEYTPEGDVAGPSPTPILITEQEVVFSTSAAVSLQRTRSTRWLTDATRIIAANLRGMFLTPTARPRPARRHYPSRYSYLEHALMAREMERL